MRTVLAALGVLCFMGSCSSGMTSSKGIVCDATMNTVAIVTDKNDTLSFSTMNANKEEVDGLLLILWKYSIPVNIHRGYRP